MNDAATPMSGTMEIQTEIKRHPIRGFLWGTITGIGLALVLVVTKVITLSIPAIVITIIVVALLATLWGLVGPAKKAGGPVPVTITPSPTPPASRFDDFEAPPQPRVAPVPEPVEAPGDETAAADDATEARSVEDGVEPAASDED